MRRLREDDVVGGVGQDGEAFVDEDAGGFDGGLDVGVEGGLVADDLDLDPVGEADLAGEAGGADGFVGGVAAGGVGHEEVARGVDEVEERFLGAVEIDAADGDGDHLGAGGLDGGGGLGAVLVLAGADDEARAETAAGDDEVVGGGGGLCGVQDGVGHGFILGRAWQGPGGASRGRKRKTFDAKGAKEKRGGAPRRCGLWPVCCLRSEDTNGPPHRGEPLCGELLRLT